MEWWTKGSRRSRRLGFSSSSGIAYQSEKAPIALDENGIHKVIADFKAATIRAVSRYQVMEIHGSRVFIASAFSLSLERMRMEEV
jgi:2,4-dienoyl-CoA reductase-like NADH-dependent reductase (Old Yellow Enzyme family)